MVTFTPDAHAELKRRVAASDKPDPVVGVYWLVAQFDLLRSPEGNAVWKEDPARWAVFVMHRDPEFGPRDEQLICVGDLRVHFSAEDSGATDVTVDFTDGQFRVQSAV